MYMEMCFTFAEYAMEVGKSAHLIVLLRGFYNQQETNLAGRSPQLSK